MSVHQPDPTDEHDPFAVLGVARGCSSDDLARAYRTLARRYHPDVNQDADAVERMRAINAAFARARQELADTAAGALHARAAVRIPYWEAAPPVPVRRDGHRLLLRWAALGGVVLVIAAALTWVFTTQRSGAPPASSSPRTALVAGQQGSLTWPLLGRVRLTERKLLTLPAGLYPRDRLQWSGDGRYAALWVDDAPTARDHPQILLFQAAGLAPLTPLAGFEARWSPTADQLALLTSDTPTAVPHLMLLDAASGRQSILVPTAGTRLAWSPDGTTIAYSAQAQHTVEIVTVGSGKQQLVYTAPRGESVVPVGWLDSATVLGLLLVANDTRLVALPLSGGTTTQIADLGNTAILPVANPITNQTVYVTPANASAPDHLVLNAKDGQSALLVDDRGGFTALGGWSADGQWLAYATQSSHNQSTAICLLPLRNMSAAGWPADATKCIVVGGTASDLGWESGPASDHLCFVTNGTAATEVDDLAVALPSPTPTAIGAARAPSTAQGRPPLSSNPASAPVGALLVVASLWWRAWGRGPRHFSQRVARRERPGSGAGARGAASAGGLPAQSEARATHVSALVPDAGPALRIGVVSEALKWPPDEALKRIALAITEGMAAHGAVLAVGTRGQRPNAETYPVEGLKANRTFLSPRLWHRFARFKPNVLCYLPGSGLTTWSLLRALALLGGLRLFGQRPLLALVTVQPRRRGSLGQWLLTRVCPALVIVQSVAARADLLAQGCQDVFLLRAGVDPTVFTPATVRMRAALRRTYIIPPDSFVVVHVGHLKRNRQLDDLIALAQRIPQITVLVAGSTSTVADPHVIARLCAAGVLVIHRYLPHIEELYQLADCYVFPVRDDQASAQLPLSVLEALACGLPAVTTRFGALPEYLPPSEAIDYCDTLDDLVRAVRARHLRPRVTSQARALALQYDWQEQIALLARELRARLSRRATQRPTWAGTTPEEAACVTPTATSANANSNRGD